MGVFAWWGGGGVFGGTAGIGRDHGVDAACGEGDDAGLMPAFCGDGWDDRVHSPCEFRLVGGTEFLTGHEEDEGGVGEGGDGVAVDEVGGERGDAVVFEEGAAGWVGEAGDGEDASGRGARGGGGAGEHEGERAAHFATGAGDEDVAAMALERFDDPVGGTGEELVEL